jgi:uncharacterized membrane protein
MRRVSRPLAAILFVVMLTACPRKAATTDAGVPAAEKPIAMSEPTTPPSDPPAAPKGKRAAGQEDEPLLAFRGFGTEPFWEARVDGDTLVFSTPEAPDGRTMHGRRVPSLVGMVYVGKDGAKDFHLGLTPGECSDGMSDGRYEYTATFIYGDATYTGCGEAAK